MQTETLTQINLACTKPVANPEINVPGSKSITNRAFLLAAMAEGGTIIRDPLASNDTLVMESCLKTLGVTVDASNPRAIRVVRNDVFLAPNKPLHVGNAGTAARFLIGLAATLGHKIEFDGDQYMRKRHMLPILDAIGALGATHDSINGRMPFSVIGDPKIHDNWASKKYRPTTVVDPSLSSQYVSALLMIAPILPCGLKVSTASDEEIDAVGYINITLQTMHAFGVSANVSSTGEWDFEPQTYRASEFQVEPDYSACTYFWAARKLGCPDLKINNIDLAATLQPDAKSKDFIDRFPNMVGIINGSQMQDSIPTLAVMAAFNNGPVRFTGIKNLRVKECDRIEAIADGLNKIRPGLATVEEDDLIVNADGKAIDVPQSIVIDSHDDHRIAMAFALFGLKAGNISISNPQCVEKTFPEFWTEFSKCGVTASGRSVLS